MNTSDEVLLGMSTLCMCIGKGTERSLRVSGLQRDRRYGTGTPYVHPIVTA